VTLVGHKRHWATLVRRKRRRRSRGTSTTERPLCGASIDGVVVGDPACGQWSPGTWYE